MAGSPASPVHVVLIVLVQYRRSVDANPKEQRANHVPPLCRLQARSAGIPILDGLSARDRSLGASDRCLRGAGARPEWTRRRRGSGAAQFREPLRLRPGLPGARHRDGGQARDRPAAQHQLPAERGLRAARLHPPDAGCRHPHRLRQEPPHLRDRRERGHRRHRPPQGDHHRIPAPRLQGGARRFLHRLLGVVAARRAQAGHRQARPRADTGLRPGPRPARDHRQHDRPRRRGRHQDGA